MRTETTTRVLYTAQELQAEHPRGFDRALDTYIQNEQEWHDSADDWASLRVLDEQIGYRRDRYPDDLTRGLGECYDMTGRRAWAWLENVVLADYRLPWVRVTAPGVIGVDRRKRHGYGYRAGAVPPCPFTGYYTDEVLLDWLRSGLSAGLSVGEVVRSLEEAVQRTIDEDMEDRCTVEAFLERAADLDLEFTEQGVQV